MVMMMIAYYIVVNYPNTNWLFCRATYPELKDSVIPQFLELFPPEHHGYEYKSDARLAKFPNKSTINFRAFDRDSKILSNEYSGATLCQGEELAKALFLMILGRLSGDSMPKPLLFVEGNPADSWCKERYVENKPDHPADSWCKERYVENKPDHILFVEGTTFDNQSNLPENYIENLKLNYPPDYIDRYLYGGWNRTSDRVYTALMDHHIIPPITRHNYYYTMICMDHGTVNDTSMVWMCKDESDNKLPIVADYSMKAGDTRHISFWDDLKRHGLRLIEAKKDKTANILMVNQGFHTNKLYIFNHLDYVIQQHKRYQYKRAGLSDTEDRKEEVVKKDDHSVDAVQYGYRHIKDIKVKSPADAFRPDIRQKTLRDYVEGRA
jgi:phage terminase large subunit